MANWRAPDTVSAFAANPLAKRADDGKVRAMNRWPIERINAWHAAQPWRVGCNFVPSTAINQIEMWSDDSFDIETIARELGWARDLGFNAMRIYLHDRPWARDPNGFKRRIDRVLHEADIRGIGALVVFFDDCWHEPTDGPQPAPRPGVHNSGWARSPGKQRLLDRSSWGELEAYVSDVVDAFARDRRVLAWDAYNEVTNIWMPSLSLSETDRTAAWAAIEAERPAQAAAAFDLMERTCAWIRARDPEQPVTVGVWNHPDDELNDRLVALSDFISFHHYRSPDSLEGLIERLLIHDRPLWCTEYLSRRDGALFETHLPIFKRHRIAAFNWGLVDGKSQTKFAWTDPPGIAEADPWFHDILHANGVPYAPDEVAFMKKLLLETE